MATSNQFPAIKHPTVCVTMDLSWADLNWYRRVLVKKCRLFENDRATSR